MILNPPETRKRHNEGVDDAEFHVSDLGGEHPLDPDNCVNFNYANNFPDRESYIALVTTDVELCEVHSQHHKFVLAHEYGHAYGFQLAELNNQTPISDAHSATPAGDCSFSQGQYTYYNNTKEWSSMAIREGFAHYASARIWNASAADGQFHWDQSFDLERWNSNNDAGGYLVNECCPGSSMSCATSLNGAGVITDWMRAFWDMHTDTTCSFDKSEMGLLYALTIQVGNLTNSNFFDASTGPASSLGCGSRWDWIACWNGIDREGGVWSGC